MLARDHACHASGCLTSYKLAASPPTTCDGSRASGSYVCYTGQERFPLIPRPGAFSSGACKTSLPPAHGKSSEFSEKVAMDWLGPSTDEVWRQFCREIGADFSESGFWRGRKVQTQI